EAGRQAEMRAILRRRRLRSDASPAIYGRFDGVQGALAYGWVADLAAPQRVLSVEFFAVAQDGVSTKLGETRANRPCDELRGIGLESSHGFARPIPYRRTEFF